MDPTLKIHQYAARWNGVDHGSPFILSDIQDDVEGRPAAKEDVLLALNRLMGAAPATNRYTGGKGYSQAIVPSPQAAKEASFIYGNSGANPDMDKQEQIRLV